MQADPRAIVRSRDGRPTQECGRLNNIHSPGPEPLSPPSNIIGRFIDSGTGLNGVNRGDDENRPVTSDEAKLTRREFLRHRAYLSSRPAEIFRCQTRESQVLAHPASPSWRSNKHRVIKSHLD